MRNYILRGAMAKVKSKVVYIHGNKCDVCAMDNFHILEAHHILPIAESGEHALENFAVLCPNCHAIIHKMMGEINQDRDPGMGEWLTEHFSSNAYGRLMNLFKKYCQMKYRR